ncbi:MAG: hypothetical protein IT427_20710 [Pirellulales bacterium]|nr:hypothetical protein [Pirellulales bacterium]
MNRKPWGHKVRIFPMIFTNSLPPQNYFHESAPVTSCDNPNLSDIGGGRIRSTTRGLNDGFRANNRAAESADVYGSVWPGAHHSELQLFSMFACIHIPIETEHFLQPPKIDVALDFDRISVRFWHNYR